MVNFPSLLVSEDETFTDLDSPDGSTIHSWINADFVPSWLRPFTLDQNTRFTRTPDHLLRPPEEPKETEEPLPGETEPLPSYGTAGASWHFLEMPLEGQDDDAPTLPSVRADLAALEQAFSDLPALRAARGEQQAADLVGDVHAVHQAEGWSVSESGVETVLSWHDVHGDLAQADVAQELTQETAQEPAQEIGAQESWAQDSAGPDGNAVAPLTVATEPSAMNDAVLAAPSDAAPEMPATPSIMGWTSDAPAPQTAWSGAAGTGMPSADFAQGAPFAAALEDAPASDAVSTDVATPMAEAWMPAAPETMTSAFASTFDAPMADEPDGDELGDTDPLDGAPLDGALVQLAAAALDGAAERMDATPAMNDGSAFTSPSATAPEQADMSAEPVSMDNAAVISPPPTAWSEPLPQEAMPQQTVPQEMLSQASVTQDATQDAPVGQALDWASAPASAGLQEPMAMGTAPDLMQIQDTSPAPLMAQSPMAHEVVSQEAVAQELTSQEFAPDTLVSEAVAHQDLAQDPAFQEPISHASMPQDPSSSDLAHHVVLPQTDTIAAPFEAQRADGVADDATDAADETVAVGAMVPALSGASLDRIEDGAMAAALLMAAKLQARTAHAVLPHLRPLTRLIQLGPQPLPDLNEQDLLPTPPQAPAPEAEAASRAADQIHAHFAWQPYHLNIAGLAAPTPPAPLATEEPALAPAATLGASDGPLTAADGTAPDSGAPDLGAPNLPVPAEAAGLPMVVDALEAGYDPFAYHLPPLDLLREPPHLEPDYELSEEFLDQSSAMLQQILRDFGIRGEVIDANPGPVVTLYEFEPAPGVKSSRVIALAADIARSMSAVSARVAVVEGRNVIGIELPNRRRDTVWLRELLASHEFEEARTKLGICLGKTIGGVPVITDLARMPHLLVAGTTGSGKSVAINTMILSLLYRHTPEACRLIMIDPKMLELSVYEGIPHLLTPVVTDPKKAIIALKWAVKEMEDRYRKMARLAVRNIDGYNARMAEAREKGEIITRQVQVGFDKESGEALYEEQQMDLSALPYIVIIVDEMADLMMVAGKEIEGAIQRLAQMARAAGIHLVMATQRPSVDVITGTIKANFPTRISFQVTSKIDSRTILGEMGAETLLGQGDMLFMAGGGRITRVHGPFVSDGEVEHVVAFLKAQGGPEYLEDVVQDEEAEGASGSDDAVFDKSEMGETGGDLYDQAVAIVLRDRKASTSYIQRRLQVGYNKAASLMERMEAESIVGPANHAGKREILSFGRDRDDDR